MQILLNLLAGVALLVWGTHLVRTDILRLYGGDLRRVLRQSVGNRFAAFGAGLTVTALLQSSTATALIVSSFVGQGLIATAPALALVLGANLGSGVRAMLNTVHSTPEARRVTLGNFLFKLIGCVVFAPFLDRVETLLAVIDPSENRLVVHFHLVFNVAIAVAFVFFTEQIARVATRLMPAKPDIDDPAKPRYLDPSALATPALAIGTAA